MGKYLVEEHINFMKNILKSISYVDKYSSRMIPVVNWIQKAKTRRARTKCYFCYLEFGF